VHPAESVPRVNLILPRILHLQASFAGDPNMKGFQMRVDGRQMEVAARVLQNPRLSYGSPANYDPKARRGVLLLM
jgi:hypothetical protein